MASFPRLSADAIWSQLLQPNPIRFNFAGQANNSKWNPWLCLPPIFDLMVSVYDFKMDVIQESHVDEMQKNMIRAIYWLTLLPLSTPLLPRQAR